MYLPTCLRPGFRRVHSDRQYLRSSEKCVVVTSSPLLRRAEKDREASAAEVMDLRSGLDFATAEKARQTTH